MLNGKKILLIISGGIAAYKSLELIRLFKKADANVRCIVTNGGAQFVTPLSVAALTEEQVYTDLFSLKDETEMGHIRLSREADLVLVAPASANLIAQMTYGLADDLASTTLLASNRPIMICPAMNPMMWEHSATQDNLKTLEQRGVDILSPNDGDMACGETGTGRMREPIEIFDAVKDFFKQDKPLSGKHALVTSGPTFEPFDPVRFIGNHSSGKQGHAIARALLNAGATVTLVTGPTAEPRPEGASVISIQTAKEMLNAVQETKNVDIAICAAAVSDWRADKIEPQKMKKKDNQDTLSINLVKNPDILQEISNSKDRPSLVIGFAAETQNVAENARKKLQSKNCNWIIANHVGDDKAFGKDENQVTIIKQDSETTLEKSDKSIIARDIVEEIIQYLNNQ